MLFLKSLVIKQTITFNNFSARENNISARANKIFNF